MSEVWRLPLFDGVGVGFALGIIIAGHVFIDADGENDSDSTTSSDHLHPRNRN